MNETYLSFPFHIAAEGAVSVSDADEHIRQRMEQVLFTSPGERVMLPEFGCGVRDFVFQGNGAVRATGIRRAQSRCPD